MNDFERKRAKQLALELQDGPDKSQRSEEYWKGFFEKYGELNRLVGPKEIVWLLQQYDNERLIRDTGIDDKRGAETRYLVEANSFETNVLYTQWSEKFSWEQHPLGCAPTIAYLKGRPLTLNMLWVTIAGELVCFWETASTLVDYDIIDQWFHIAFPNVDHDNERFNTHAKGFSYMMNQIKQKLDGDRGLEKLRKG